MLGGLFQVWFLHAQATFWRYQFNTRPTMLHGQKAFLSLFRPICLRVQRSSPHMTRRTLYPHTVRGCGIDHCYDCTAEISILRAYLCVMQQVKSSGCDKMHGCPRLFHQGSLPEEHLHTIPPSRRQGLVSFACISGRAVCRRTSGISDG